MNLTRTKLFLKTTMVLAVTATLALDQQAGAGTWNNAAGGNWSVAGNWSPVAVPGTADSATFGNTGAGQTTTDDITGETINSLIFDWNNQLQHNLVINPGKTLTVNSAVAAGSALLLAGSAAASPAASSVTPVTISGAGGSLVLNGVGDVVVRLGNGTAGSHMATLDMSGLDNLTATIGRLLVGQANAGGAVNRPSGTLILARTNNLTMSGASPQVMLQDAGSNANGSTASALTFGQVNNFNADIMRLGGQKGNANMNFNGAFSLPSLKMRNTDGVSRISIIDFGYNGATSSGNSTVLVADFSLGTIDLAANLINIAQGNPGPLTGTCTATVTLGAGTVDANDLEIGWGNATSGTIGGVTATVNVNNSGLFPAGAVLKANTLLRLARTNGATGANTGTLNINGGTVMANSIVSGGGTSIINLNSFSPSSTLIISNTAGTLATPIGTLSLNDAVLQVPALNGAAVVAVKTLTVGGSANTIKVSSIPPIGSYPADFTLINYQTGYTPGAGPLSLGALPAASPAYSGTLVDSGGGVIQLHLTAGPVAVLGMHWTGASSSDWDLSTYNWTFQGFATNFFNGSSPLFDDASTQTNVNLTASLSPGTITVSNTAEPYIFTGVGNIAGAGSLTKKGASTFTIANEGVDNIGTVVISAGTLQIGAGDVNGSLSAVNITNNGTLAVNRSGSLTLSANISGTGSLTKSGNGTLVLSGSSSYSGSTTLSGGTLEVDGTLSGAGALTTSANTVLAGGGTISGAITASGQINPGTPSTTGILNAGGGLTLNSGSTLSFNLSPTDPSNPAVNDSINVTGNLNLNNNQITVNINGIPQGGASYALFTYSGTLSGSFNPVVLGSHFGMALDTTSPGIVILNITTGSGSALEWASPSDSTWDQVVTNWMDLTSGQASTFNSGDTVLLDDTNGVITTLTIPAGVNISPASITDTATNNYYTINGAGHITGGGNLVMSGGSTLVLGTANTFSGTVDVQNGTLQIGSSTALGTTASGTTVQTGGTLDLNGQNIGGEVVTISGPGFNNVGALVNNGGGQAQAIRQIVLAGDATIGGTGLIGMNNGGGTASLSTGGSPYTLTKVGANQLTFQNSSIDIGLGNIDIQQGTIEFNSLTASMGDPTYTNIVEAGGTVSFANNSIAWVKQFDFTGNGSTTTVNNGTSANTELDGPVAVHGSCVFNVGGTLLTLTNEISGDGGIIKNGATAMIFSGPTTFTGDTTINNAALRLNGVANLAFSTNITINAGGFLTVTGMPNATFILYADHNLSGNGVVVGKLTANAGSTVSPGVNAIGMLTASNTITLLGTNIMELDPDNNTNDVLKSAINIVYGGTLNLVDITSPLANGNSFKLFNAASYSGTFAAIVPATPGPGLIWNTSALASSGTISVVSTAPLNFGGATIVGGNAVITGSGGTPSGLYHVLSSTNLALPLGSWARIATNSFDGSGNFAFTNSLAPAVPQRFYQIELP